MIDEGRGAVSPFCMMMIKKEGNDTDISDTAAKPSILIIISQQNI
jgi:hypothetical protein